MSRSLIKNKLLITSMIISMFLTSCASRQDVVYFQNAKSFETIVDTNTFTARLKVGDVVSIYVSTLDPTVTQPYNLIKSTGNQGELIDYLIDIEGNIDYPVLGKIKLLGLTVEEAKALFKKKFAEGQLLKNPVIIFRVLNFRVTVAGEVRNPGVYPVTGERISILEALGMAGDLTIKGRRDNVLIVRDFNGAKTYTRIDLTNKEVFNSPVYYLTQNDYVYVEPNKSGISGASGNANLGTIITVSTFLITTTLLLITRN